MYKRLLRTLLSIIICVSLLPIQSEAASIKRDAPVFVELFSDSYSNDIQIKTIKLSGQVETQGVYETTSIYGATDDYWSKYRSVVYYEKLNQNQKALYDTLYKICMNYLTTNADIETAKSGSYVYSNCLQFIPSPGLSKEQAKTVVNIFCDANPQFYFIYGSGLLYATIGGSTYISTNFDTTYKKGTDREKTTATIKKKLDGWNSTISKESGDYNKALKIYEVVAKQLTYNNDVLSDASALANSQNVKTAILNGKAVCAGYSELYEMLASYAGMSCCTVTYSNGGVGHEWNQIKVGGKWYNLDITWDDSDDNVGYRTQFFLKSDKTFKNLKNGNHIPESFYSGIRPTCPEDYKASDKDDEDSNDGDEINDGYAGTGLVQKISTGKKLNATKTKLTLTIKKMKPAGKKKIKKVRVKVWNKAKGKKSAKYFTAKKKGKNYVATINLLKLKGKGKYQVEIYCKYNKSSKEKLVGKMTFKR